MQEIQEALDERQNNLDSLFAGNRIDRSAGEPFAFESQLDVDTQPVDLSSRSFDDSLTTVTKTETNLSNDTIPILAADNNDLHRAQRTTWTVRKEPVRVKKEAITPPKSKNSSTRKKKNVSSTSSSMRQMTMTQLFEPVESSPASTGSNRSIKNEVKTPTDDSMMHIPESLVGLAERSDYPSNGYSDDNEDDEQNQATDLTLPLTDIKKWDNQSSFKRKSIPSDSVSDDLLESNVDEAVENVQNQALIQTPYTGVETEELLYACPMCRNYWLALPEGLRHKQGLQCRHRQRPVARTPEHFWSLGIPNTQTCIQRGYGGILPPEKPIERPRRPRRQHQRLLQEKQRFNNDPDDDDDDD